MQPRPFQSEALAESLSKYRQGVTRQLISLPTGTGKTPLFSMLRGHHGFKKKVMVLVPREELAEQAADKLAVWNPGAGIGVEMAERWADAASDEYIVASVFTLGQKGRGEDELYSKRLQRFKPDEFDAIVVDEAHHAVAETYIRVFTYFGLLDERNSKLLLGVTATPNRGDKVGLGAVFDQIIYEMSILDAIKQGWLVDVRGLRVYTKTNLDNVHTRAGDLAQNELEREVNTPERNKLVIKAYLDHGEGRKMVGFAVDIAHAKALAAEARGAGIAADAVWGSDPQRTEKLQRHKDGKLLLLFNAMVLTEGYDDPSIGGIIMARPTKSTLLYTQIIGRALRLPVGVNNLIEAIAAGEKVTKRDALIIDVTDNSTKHSLMSLPSLMGLPANMDLKGGSATAAVARLEQAQIEHPEADMSQLKSMDELEKVIEHIDLFHVKWDEEVLEHSKLQWHKSSDGSYVLVMPNRETVVVWEDLLGKWNVHGSVEGQSVSNKGFGSLESAFRFADDMVKIWGRDSLTLVKREAAWRKDEATPAQKMKLKKLGIPVPPNLTKGQAQLAIAKKLFKPRQ